MTRYKYRVEEKEKHQDRPIVREKRRGRGVTRAKGEDEQRAGYEEGGMGERKG